MIFQILNLIIGMFLGSLILWIIQRVRLGSFQTIAQNILKCAQSEAENYKKTAEFSLKQNHIEQQKEMDRFWQSERKKIQREEERVKVKEDKLEARMNLVEKKLLEIEKRETVLANRKLQFDEEKIKVEALQTKVIKDLENISGLTSIEAKDILVAKLTNDVRTECAHIIRRTKREAEESADNEAKRVIISAINRLASSSVSEATVSTVSIPSEEMKGRIIGREGRNIRALERATGISFIIDETPGAVVLSGFDPIRKHIAKLALTELLLDGRIHPTRIEEAVETASKTVSKQVRQAGEDAALRAGTMNLHPEILILLGKLKFRFSYGQNVLDHSIEVAHLMGLMAAELGLDVRKAKRIGLLHDMGKAVTHEIEGSHALIGYDLALKYGETQDVANGIGCHHQEIDPISPEGSLCSAADSISASRPGARIEAVEEYVKRLKRLEDIAYEFEGVEKAFAMQAGREVRVIVLPEIIDDDGLIHLARNLTKRIESDLEYPGKIKVTVIREKRAIEYAV